MKFKLLILLSEQIEVLQFASRKEHSHSAENKIKLLSNFNHRRKAKWCNHKRKVENLEVFSFVALTSGIPSNISSINYMSTFYLDSLILPSYLGRHDNGFSFTFKPDTCAFKPDT